MIKFGIDIGGTTVKIGMLDDNNNIIDKASVKTLKDEVMTLYLIREQIDIMLDKYDILSGEIMGIGIGSPGAVDDENGVIDIFPNAGWKGVKIANFFRSCYNVPVKVSNDANVATLAEMVMGSGKDLNSFIYVTLGTGVGGGIVIDKKLFRGNKNKGAEIGHMIIKMGGKKCNCGRNGCFEAYASAPALIDLAKDNLNNKKSLILELADNKIENIDGKIIFDAYKKGDEVAIRTVDEYVVWLSEGLMNLMNIFRPDGIVLGGGISLAGNVLIDKVKKYCEERFYGYPNTPSVIIRSATFFNDAGILGAGLLIK